MSSNMRWIFCEFHSITWGLKSNLNFHKTEIVVISLSSLTQCRVHPRTSRESFNLFRVWVDHHFMRTSRENEQKCKFPFVMFRVSFLFLFSFFRFTFLSKKNEKEITEKTRLVRRHYNDFYYFFPASFFQSFIKKRRFYRLISSQPLNNVFFVILF